MKKILQSTLAIALISLGFTSSAQTRYLDDVFSTVTVTNDIDYATNISILPMLQGLPPGPASLKFDIYEPTGDSVVNRPVIILVHTGSFLPPVLNGQATGSKEDFSIVEQCTRWAKMGYVAIAMDNRLGWNPTSTDQDVRTSSLLQAAYRGIQDAKAMVRYMRMTEDNGNPHGINSDKIVLGGQGTGAYISLGYATLDNPAVELMLPKFINFNATVPTPYVYPPFFGNPDGTDSTYLPAAASPTSQDELWNIPNNNTYSNDINMVFNLGGAIADISWLETGDVPMVSFHCEMDPYAPLDTGDVIVPTTGEFVVEVMGSRTIQQYIHTYGNNMPFATAGISDVYTTAANVNNGGLEGLYIFKTPSPSTTPNAFGELEEEQGSPWDWWDNGQYDAMFQAVNGAPAGYGAANSLLGNPNMSSTNGNAYLDTIQGYLNPRMYETLNLSSNTNILGVYGCTDINACNYDASANSDDNSCDLPDGCGDPLYVEYDASVTCSDVNACITLITNSIYDIVSNSADHTTLEVAIDACGLDGVLSDPGSLTLFAPTDAAFNLLPSGTVTALLADIPQLTDILKHHVVGASVMSGMLSNNQVVTTLLGTDVTVTINSMGVFIDNAQVTFADIVADNGVVHVIDAVLIPSTTGTDELIGDFTNIYPNPANNYLNIFSNFNIINTISIYNLQGQEVLNSKVNASQIRLNISSLQNGVYLIDISSKDDSVKRKLIIE